MAKLLEGHSRPVAQGVTSSALWEFLYRGVPALVTWYFAHQAALRGWAWPWVIIFGLIVFLLAAVVVDLLRGRRSGSSSKDIAATESPECPDKWLHEIARDQAATIYRFLNVTRCVIAKNELLGRNDPYIEIQLALDNRSVYDVSLDDPQGFVSYNGRELSGELSWAEQAVPAHNNEGVVTLKQRLDELDVSHVLNGSEYDTFDFTRLRLQVNGIAPFNSIIEPKPLSLHHRLTNSALFEKYPKLDIQIKSAEFKWITDMRNNMHDILEGKANYHYFVAIATALINRRAQHPRLQRIKLTVTIQNKHYVAFAETAPWLWPEYVIRENGIEKGSGSDLNNLASSLPLVVPEGRGVDGSLEFRFDNIKLEEPFSINVLKEARDAPFILTLIDKSGEEHVHTGKLNTSQISNSGSLI